MDKKSYTYSGNLELYWEQGFEGHDCVILHDDRGLHTGPTFNNETKKWDGPPMQYKNICWAHFFDVKSNDHLTVYDKYGQVIYEGRVSQAKRSMNYISDHHSISFIPDQIKKEDWLHWITQEFRAKVVTSKPCIMDEKKEVKDAPVSIEDKKGNHSEGQ